MYVGVYVWEWVCECERLHTEPLNVLIMVLARVALLLLLRSSQEHSDLIPQPAQPPC